MQAEASQVILLTGLSASRSSWVVRQFGAGQTLTQAPQPIHSSRSNSGFPLYLSGTLQGTSGKRVVNRGENTAVTASFSSLNFGQRNLTLLIRVSRIAICGLTFALFIFYFLVCSAYLSTTLFSREGHLKHKPLLQLRERRLVKLSG